MSDAEYLRAWVVILFEVNHTSNKVMVKKKLINCDSGQSLNSIETWGRLFGNWGRSKVNRFFDLLKSEEMITMENLKITSRLTVCNYSTYQDAQTARNTPHDTPHDTARKQHANSTHATNKNEKNEKNDKETPIGAVECEQELFIEPVREVTPEPTQREIDFEAFWVAYGRKGNKKSSKALFLKLTDNQVDEIRCNLPAYLISTQENIKYRKDAQVYLNNKNEHWNDFVFVEEKKDEPTTSLW